MKALILYYSNYKHNTEKLAKVFARKINCDLINIESTKDINLENYDLIGFGSGVYKESMAPKLFKLVDRLNLKGKNVFVFSTSGVGMKFYNNKLLKLLKEKGAIIKGSFACKGSFIAKEFSDNKIFDFLGKLSQGHPNEKDFKKAEEFITKLVKLL
ncbi:MAG: flavodoxin [Clostridiales bacterium]|uniref:Flavodoxin n=1 Tax=Clostridium isatidis TaxID=182773 RepID=A0A343JEL5_9CLOT|nr:MULTISPECIES: flavodoxin family protein [Eubacteriales]ASW43973.1 flavodoxin [Clostridium isatidis]MBU5455594.1 flavodoxin [Caproiciproducens sp. MSJ-32]NLZ47762.1 flavodoxin [Clostridiales bacterium]